MDVVEAIRIKALFDVMDGEDFAFHYRRVCRWFSTTFHMPLPEVEDLPAEYVLKHYFEHQFDNMSKGERRKLAIEITETEAERKKRKKQEKSRTDEAFLARIAKEAYAKEQAAKKKKAEEDAQVKKRVEEDSQKEIARLVTPAVTPVPEITMTFDDGGNLLEEESLPLPPRKR